MAYERAPRNRVVRGRSIDELRRTGRRTSEEFDPDVFDLPFVRLGSSAIGAGQDVVQRIGDAIIGGDFGGNARGSRVIDIQLERMVDSFSPTPDATKVASGDGSVVFGRSSRAAGTQGIAVGVGAIADGNYSMAFGGGTALGAYSLAVGLQSAVDAGKSYGVAIGGQAHVAGSGGIALGNIAEAVGAGSIAIGENEVYAVGLHAIAIGQEARADGAGAVTLGAGAASAAYARSVALGYGAVAGAADQVVIAGTALLLQTSAAPLTYKTVAVDGASPSFATVKLTNLTDGYLPYHVSDASGLANGPVYTDGMNVGIGTAALGGNLHVDQSSTTAAIPVLVLDQADLSEEFIEFTSTVGAGNPIDTAALGAYYGKVRVNVTGVGYKSIALYD